MRVPLLSLLLLFTLNLAQGQWEPRFKVALVFGGNASQIDGDNLAGYHKWGLTGGARAYAMLNDNLSLSLELLYSQKGSRSTKHELHPDSAVYIHINYAEIPVMFNYHDQDRAIFGIGASYARFLGYKHLDAGKDRTESPPIFFNRDICFLAEVTFIIWKRFGINARYNYSLVPIAYNPLSRLEDNKVLNSALSFRMHYFFN